MIAAKEATSGVRARKLKIVWNFLRIFMDKKWSVMLALLAGVLTIISNISLLGLSSYIISTAALPVTLAELMLPIVGVRFFGISRGVFRYLERVVSHNTTFSILGRVRVWFYKRIEPLDTETLTRKHSGDLLSRMVGDVESLREFYLRVFNPPLVAFFVLVITFIFLSFFDRTIAIAYGILYCTAGFIVPVIGGIASKKAGIGLPGKRAELNRYLADYITGLSELEVFGATDSTKHHIMELSKAVIRTERHNASVNGLTGAMVNFLGNGTMLLTVVLCIPLVTSARLQGNHMAMLAIAAMSSFEAVQPLASLIPRLFESSEAMERLYEIGKDSSAISIKPLEHPPMNWSAATPYNGCPEIELRRAGMEYGGERNWSLQDITFRLSKGERIALVGPTGAGKSSIMKLLLGTVRCSSGEVLINGVKAEDMDGFELRSFFSVLTQNPYIFHGTILENLLMADPYASLEKVMQATKVACIHELILTLPKGYDTVIGERGYKLSGGELQRLAIARTILKDAPVLLLDEPTSNLDAETEEKLMKSILAYAKEKSLLLITHRLISMEEMNEILVIDEGKITDRGKHTELMNAGGLYRQLLELQGNGT